MRDNIFIRRPILAFSIAIVTLLLGGIAIFNLSIEQYPNITPPVVQVTAQYTGADAQTVNNSVATPIAQSVMGVSDMLYMQSTSANDGSMTMDVVFNIGADPDISTVLTQGRVSSASASLPTEVIEEGVVTEKSNDNFLLIYALHSSNDNYDGIYLTNYAYLNLQNEILKIDGVSEVSILGAGEYAMRVWVDPQMMDYYGVNYSDISDAIAAQGGLFPAGKFGAEPTSGSVEMRYTVLLPPQISTAEQFDQIVLKATSVGEVIRLGDVARLNLGSETYDVASRFGGDPTALILVYQSVGSNAVEVGAEVRELMGHLSARFPEGVECSTIVDSTSSIDAGIEDIFRTLLIALLLVISIIYLFLQSFRATLIPLLAIPVSLVGAFILFPALGFSINIVSLLGLVLAIGLVVDDAIVVVEAAQLNIERGMTPPEAAQAAMRSVTSPIIATTLVLLSIFLPICFIDGLSGLLFQQFAVTICFSVLLSAFNALSLSPALAAMLLRPRVESKRGLFGRFNRWYDSFSAGYSQHVRVVVRHAGRVVIFTVVVLLVILFVGRSLPGGFLPEEDEGYVMVMVELPINTPLHGTLDAMSRIDRVIATLPEVESTPYTAGFNMLAGISQSNCGILFAQLVDYSKRKLSAGEIATRLNEMLYVEVPEAMSFAFIPPSIPGLGLASGVTFEVQDLEGRGAEYLYSQTLDIIEHIKGSGLTSQITTQYQQGVPQRLLTIDNEHALAMGIDPVEVYESVGMMLGGSYEGTFNRFGRLYDIYIEAAPEFRMDQSSLESYTFRSSEGVAVPLTAFATLSDTLGVNYISQFNLYESIGLTLTPADRVSSTTIIDYITDSVQSALPNDIAIAWSGVSYQQLAQQRSLLIVYPLVILFAFLVLAGLYNSWSLPLAVLFSVPSAVLGALLSIGAMHLLKAEYVNDIYMQISLVLLIALSAKSAILVVEYAKDNLYKDGMPLDKAATEAARARLRPILMTAFAFILGVMPLIFASGVYSTARNIMGVALVGGMILSTVVGIYIYPALFYIVGRIAHFDKKKEESR